MTGATGYEDAKLPPGHLVSGRFRIVRFVGAGGMGEVYEAEDSDLGGRVALKTILPHLLANPVALTRFRREIQVARQVTHAHVCRVYDVGRDVYGEQELVYFTMEFLDGETLTSWVQTVGAGTQNMLPVCRQIAEGLDALHAQGIVHRDLKPANVMMVQSAAGVRAVIGDFGLARPTGSELATFTQTEGIVGTLAYMPPEVLAGEPATPASDLWAFGLLLHELAAGRRAGPGQKIDPSLPQNWIAAIQRCLLIEPAQRPKSAAAVLDELTAPVVQRKPGRPWIALGSFLMAVLLITAAWFTFPQLHPHHPANSPPAASSANAEGVRDLLARYYKPGNVAAAISTLDRTVSIHPDSAYEHGELGYAYWLRFGESQNQKDLDLAMRYSARAIALDSGLTQPHLTEALYYLHSGRTELAQAQIQQAFSIDRNNPDAYAAQAALLRAEGRPSEAEAPLQRAVDLAPEDWRWPNQLGALYRLTGQFDKAASAFEASLRLAPDNAGALGSLAGVYLKQSRYPDAERTFERAIAADPQYRFYSGLGATLMLQGNYSDATRMFRKALDLNPKSYIAWANSGSAYSWAQGQKPQAQQAYREAIRLAEAERTLTPKDATLLSRLGGYYAAINDAARAVPLLRQALALQADSPEVVYTAAEAYEILHRRDDALRWIKEAIRLGYPMSYIESSPELAGLRADPRFSSLRKLSSKTK